MSVPVNNNFAGGLYDEDDYDQMQDQATDRTSQEDDYDKMYN